MTSSTTSSSSSSARGYGGLVNMGLTCYANAVIQCIRHCPQVAWLLDEGKYNTLFSKSPKEKRQLQQALVKAFAGVVQMLEVCTVKQSVRPGEFWSHLAPAVADTLYEQLSTKAPHDSHEFYLFLLESLHESTATDVEMRIRRPPPQTPEDELIHGALQAWQREFSKEYSPFVDLFYGLGHWRTVCQSCQNVSHRWESFNSLKVAVPPGGLGAEPPTIASLLVADTEAELVSEYHCDKCPQRTEAKRFYSIWRLPQTIILVLKRFTHDGRKIHTRIAPLEGNSLDFKPFFSDISPERLGVTTYSLRGIVDHHGSSYGGHYTAQARHRGDDKWVLYDDESVMDMGGRHGALPIYGDSTYMLFLERGATAAAATATSVPDDAAAEA